MPKISNRKVLFLPIPLTTPTPLQEPKTAFRNRPPTPYPEGIHGEPAFDDEAIDELELDVEIRPRHDKPKFLFETKTKFKLAAIEESCFRPESGPTSEDQINRIYELKPDLKRGLVHTLTPSTTESPSSESDSCSKSKFPLSSSRDDFLPINPAARLENFIPAHEHLKFPHSSFGIENFSTARLAALLHHEENTDTYVAPDGSRYPALYLWMRKLIISKIQTPKMRTAHETGMNASRKPNSSVRRKDLHQAPPIQPQLGANIRSAAIPVAEEALKQINSHEGLQDPDSPLENTPFSKSKNQSRSPFSFPHPHLKPALTLASTAAFPCLCKEGFASRVGAQVVSIAIAALFSPSVTDQPGTAEPRKFIPKGAQAQMHALLGESMSPALADIAEAEDGDRTCGWLDMTHVQLRMRRRVLRGASEAVVGIASCLQTIAEGREGEEEG